MPNDEERLAKSFETLTALEAEALLQALVLAGRANAFDATVGPAAQLLTQALTAIVTQHVRSAGPKHA